MANLNDAEQQRILDLQAEVIGMRRVLPKTYRKLMKIEYSHFTSNLKRGVCTVPPEMLNVDLSSSAAVLDQHLRDIAEVQPSMQPEAAAAFETEVRQRARSVRDTRLALSRMRRRKPATSWQNPSSTAAAAATTTATTKTTTITTNGTQTTAKRRDSECSDAEL